MLIKLLHGPPPQGSVSTEYEVVLLQVYNVSASACPVGGHLCFDHTASVANFLGRAVTQPATANLNFYAGASPKGIAATTWGLCQCYGILEECAVDGGTTDANLNNSVIPTNGSFYANAPIAHVVGTTAILQGYGWILVMETLATTSGTTRCLIRAM